MANQRCPGQDRRFWNSDDIYEIPCPRCAHPVEFFRDEGMRKCPVCETQVRNPKVLLGCAQWCQFAEECVGYQVQSGSDLESIYDRLLSYLKTLFGPEQGWMNDMERTLDKVDILIAQEGGTPLVAKMAAIFYVLSQNEVRGMRKTPKTQDVDTNIKNVETVRVILSRYDLAREIIERVCSILSSLGLKRDNNKECIECKIVRDACHLKEIEDALISKNPKKLDSYAFNVLKTETAKREADRLCSLYQKRERR